MLLDSITDTPVPHGPLTLLFKTLCTLPPHWAREAAAVDDGRSPAAMHTQPKAVQRILQYMGWVVVPPGGGEGKVYNLASLTVRVATALQLQGVQQQRREEYHAPFLRNALALGPAVQVGEGQHQHLRLLLTALWRLRWDNHHKEVFWRLTMDGLPTAQRMHSGASCLCGAVAPGTVHHLWECPIAGAVAVELEAELGAAAGTLLRGAVWLMQAPKSAAGQQLDQHVWRVVCLAALCAMRSGWKHAAGAAHRWEGWQQQQQQQHPASGQRRSRQRSLQAPPQPSVAASQRHAVLHFWGLLGDYARLDKATDEQYGRVGVNHPFLHSSGQPPLCWVVRQRPAPVGTGAGAAAAAPAAANGGGAAAAAPAGGLSTGGAQPGAAVNGGRRPARQLTLAEAWAGAGAWTPTWSPKDKGGSSGGVAAAAHACWCLAFQGLAQCDSAPCLAAPLCSHCKACSAWHTYLLVLRHASGRVDGVLAVHAGVPLHGSA